MLPVHAAVLCVAQARVRLCLAPMRFEVFTGFSRIPEVTRQDAPASLLRCRASSWSHSSFVVVVLLRHRAKEAVALRALYGGLTGEERYPVWLSCLQSKERRRFSTSGLKTAK